MMMINVTAVLDRLKDSTNRLILYLSHLRDHSINKIENLFVKDIKNVAPQYQRCPAKINENYLKQYEWYMTPGETWTWLK